MLLEKQRLAAVESAGPRAVRDRAARADRRRAGLEGAQVAQARHPARPHPGRARSCRSRSASGERAASRTRVTRGYVKKAADAIYKDLVRKKIAVEKRRPDGRGTEEIRPITTEVGSLAADARLGALHARSDADPDALHARHREGAAADRRPLDSSRSAATCTTTTSRPTRSGRRASCAARSGATSATARSRSGRSRR